MDNTGQGRTVPNSATREEDELASTQEGYADRPPTAEEEEAAEAAEDELDESGMKSTVAEHAKEMYERGASQKGEGRIE